ncbi:SDR family NAD(P)-dependent oxidoreductase [Nocardia nova]|uniref:SDR family NAD(P)-dependent oxidoreductase n=1 Tax=Nocardia nova TaxID=37330 RepID=UPI0018958C96|nr:SDR family NAD(P)-dependent oxidoreductase [Nocardia nova]MBF6143823.1 SDR family NAD(P)-dependent oxidoreductase [Nocardia nova]MDN2500829.1 SDR family NAD(P)-dependent oxidoreductase [Nocardia nova]
MRALVTGASAGIGRAFATALAAEGISVTAVARDAVRLADLVGELGAGHDHLAADLSTEKGVAATALLLHRGGYSLLINNAGTAVPGAFTEVAIESSLATIDLNCRAVVTLAHAFLTSAAAGSALVNVSSTLGHSPKPGLSVYSASKAFVTAFSETLWHEQKTRGVHVMALCPGVTATASQTAADVPPWLVQSPEEVVRRARKALAHSEGPIVLSSRANRLWTTAMRLLPRRTALTLLADRGEHHVQRHRHHCHPRPHRAQPGRVESR